MCASSAKIVHLWQRNHLRRPPAVAPPIVASPIVPPTHDRASIEAYTGPDFVAQPLLLTVKRPLCAARVITTVSNQCAFIGNSWEACEHENFGGSCLVFGAGDYRRLPAPIDRAISSLRPINREPSSGGLTPAGSNFVVLPTGAQRTRHPLWLFEHGNFDGASLRAIGDVPNLASAGFNDIASSIFISYGTWQFCEHADYGGRCFTAGPGQYAEMPAGMNDTISSFRRIR